MLPKQKEEDDEKKSVDPFSFCDVYELFNHVQFVWTKLFIDIRPKQQFDKQAITQFLNIPNDILNDENCDEIVIAKFNAAKKTKLGEKIEAIFVVNGSKMDETIEFTKYFQKLIVDTYDLNDIPIYILNTDFDNFRHKFPFLCHGIDDDKYGIHKYPSQILNDKLFLGNMTHAVTKQILLNLKITHIINMTPQFTAQKFDVDKDLNIKYLQCPIYDNETVVINTYFEKAINFINNALNEKDKDNKVLVHCQAGVSRSSTIIIAYLMKMQNMKFEDAYKYTLARREIIEPNNGFVKQLKLWQRN